MNVDAQLNEDNAEISTTYSKYESVNNRDDICKVDIWIKLSGINNLINKLENRLKSLEKGIQVKEFANKLNKHYEQSRCCKRNS